MASPPPSLLATLPPELRNEVYAYLSIPSPTSTPSATGLPLKLKTYTCKHTAVQICPAHHGSLGLLASNAFEETTEYTSWLLNNAIELKIGVTFKGRVNTFVQADWDKKIEAHLRKLAKLHSWIKKVARYDVTIRWAPMDGVLKSRMNRKVAGRIVGDMVSALTVLLDDGLKSRKGEVDARLCLAHSVAVQTMLTGTRFGLAELLAHQNGGFKRRVLEVRKEMYVKPSRPERGALLVPVPVVRKDEDCLLAVENGLVRWAGDAGTHLVTMKHQSEDEVVEISVREHEQHGCVADHVTASLIRECAGLR